RRDAGEKQSINVSAATNIITKLLDEIQSNMFNQAKKSQMENTFQAKTYDEFKSLLDKGGFICCGWDGSVDSEMAIKLETKATIRCIISNKPPKGKNCIYSGRPAKYEVVYAKSY
ncbi:uncharacterized protein METZ01_LOCUS449197, partial [marine metagenome]